MSRWLITIGIILIVAGVLLPWLQRMGLGRLPGDFVIERLNFSIYIPLGSSILISVVLSALLWLINKW